MTSGGRARVRRSDARHSGCPENPRSVNTEFQVPLNAPSVLYASRSGGLDGDGYSDPVTDRDPVAEVEAALDAFDVAYDQAAEAIKAVPDPDEAFRRANELAEKIRQLNTAAAVLRTETAGRVWNSERMSLSVLADRIGVSTTRAHQLIKQVKKGLE